MPIRLKYKTIRRPDGTLCYGPWIPVIVRGHEETVELIFLLDSGADYSVLPIEVAEILGLDLSNPAEQSSGVGGSVNTIKSNAKIIIKNAHETYNFRIPIHILMNRNSKIPPLLGRVDFFDQFEIIIKQKIGKVILKKEHERSY